MTTFSETTLPALIFSVPAGHPKGDVPALGRLTVNEAQGQNQSWLVWGCETNDDYTHTDSTGSGALFYEAESRTLLSGSTVVTLSGSSGGGTNNAIISAALPTSYTPILSTQATGGGANLTHVGQFRVFARVQSTAASTGSVSMALDWAYGDFLSFTRNDATTLTSDMAASFRIVDLGVVALPKPASGSQRWQGKIVALSSVGGDTLNVDCMWLVPVAVGSGEASAAPPSVSSLDLAIYDAFNQTAGALTGKTTSIGSATWTSVGGDTDDWTVDATNHIATRTTTSDTARRVISAGTAAYTALTAQMDVRISAFAATITRVGLALRIVDASNFYVVEVGRTGSSTGVDVRRVTAGSFVSQTIGTTSVALSTWYTVKVSVDTAGRLLVSFYPQGGSAASPLIDITHSQLASGGSHASGKIGIMDINQPGDASTRDLDNFVVYTPSSGGGTDAVMFANQSAEVRYDGVIREDSSGTFWQPVGSYEGDLLKVPVTGREGRSVRFIVKASRNAPTTGIDSAIDDINATLAVSPRYLSVPAPA